MAHFIPLCVGCFATAALAHMQLVYPAPFNASNNPHRITPADPYLQYPYDCCGPSARWIYPCRGYHTLLGTPQGAPTATWEAGSTRNWAIAGIGDHYGGSCQVGFSIDAGETFQVATSYEGNCPHRNAGNEPDGQAFALTVPHDLPAGVQLFAWIWYNREQELNMDCAAVNITPAISTNTSLNSPDSLARRLGTSSVAMSSSSAPAILPPSETTHRENSSHANNDTRSVRNDHPLEAPPRDRKRKHLRAPKLSSFSYRPTMLVADNGNGCLTPKTNAELKFPDPGPDIVRLDGEYPLALPSGTCRSTWRALAT